MRKSKVAVIGIGNMGKNHARVYSEIANLVAVSDVNEQLGKTIAKQFNIKYYKNYKRMLQEETLEAISVVVPTALHKRIVLDCLENKIPTFVEKPIAHTLSDAKQMLASAKKNKTMLFVGHIERFNPAVVKLKTLIDRDVLGKIISLLAIRVGINPPNSTATDVALDLGIHDVDVFNFLLGSFPEKKKLIKTKLFSKNIADSSTILLQYGTITSIIQTNWITPIKLRKLYVTGVKGYAEVDYIKQKLTLYDQKIHTTYDGSFYQLVALSENPKKEVYISKKEPLKKELSYFLTHKTDWMANNLEYALEALRIVK